MFALPLYVAHTSGMESGMREFFRLVSMLVSIPVALYSGCRSTRARGTH